MAVMMTGEDYFVAPQHHQQAVLARLAKKHSCEVPRCWLQTMSPGMLSRWDESVRDIVERLGPDCGAIVDIDRNARLRRGGVAMPSLVMHGTMWSIG